MDHGFYHLSGAVIPPVSVINVLVCKARARALPWPLPPWLIDPHTLLEYDLPLPDLPPPQAGSPVTFAQGLCLVKHPLRWWKVMRIQSKSCWLWWKQLVIILVWSAVWSQGSHFYYRTSARRAAPFSHESLCQLMHALEKCRLLAADALYGSWQSCWQQLFTQPPAVYRWWFSFDTSVSLEKSSFVTSAGLVGVHQKQSLVPSDHCVFSPDIQTVN